MKGKLKNSKGITLVALVITIVIIIILSTIAYNFTFGENGLITRAQQAAEMSEVSRILEQLEMAKGSAYIDGQGEIDPDHYFDILEEEEIINDKETDVVDNGDGTYDVTTEGDRVFEITLTPDGDLDIEYVGNNDEPRISGINVTEKTDSSISVEVITKNVDGGEYTYSYKKTEEGEETWQEAGSSSDSTFTFSGLDNNTSYDIKVTVNTGDTTIEKTITVQLGTEIVEVPDGTISFGEVVWQGDGTASMTVTTSEPDFTLQYQVGGTDDQWTTITSGQSITGLKHGDTVYTRLTDGTDTNTSEIQETTIEDTTPPTINVTLGTSTSSSIAVNVEATDAESGMAGSLTYTYYIKQNGQDDSSYTIPGDASNISSNTYTFAGLTQGIGYDIKVEVKSDAAGNTGVGTLTNQITTSIPGGDTALEDGTITIEEPTWSGGKASIEVSTKSMYTLEYQINGTDDNSWTPVSGDTISNLSHGDKVNIRLTDGVNAGGYVTKEIKDEILPIVSVTPQGTTSNSVSVNVIATDNESGMVASPTYTYYIKKTSEEDTAYAEKATGITESTYTFTSLEQGTSYDVKVEVTGDVAGNTGSGTLTNQTTERIPAGEDDIVEGAITFGQVSWNAGVASITIDTSTNYTIEYQVGSIEGSWTEIEKGGIIPNLKYGDTVYARLTDGYNHGDYATANISDTIPPTITEVSSSKTTNSVTLEVTSADNESGMPDTINYKFEIKQSNEPDSSYQEIQTGTNTTATKDGLAQGTRYTVRVTTVDKAGNTGTFTKDIITDRVDGATDGLKGGNLIASEPEWADGSASITLSTTTSYQIQWQKVSQGQMIGSNWNDYDGAITGLKHGDMVYARLWDGQNAGQEASVTIEDKIQPEANIEATEVTTDSITVKVTASDAQTGLATSETYRYYLNDEENPRETSTSDTYTYSQLNMGTEYTLKVVVKDLAGNEKEATVQATTKKKLTDTVLPTAPELSDGMTPVKWDEDQQKWIKTTTDDWYEYQNKKWANVVLVGEDGLDADGDQQVFNEDGTLNEDSNYSMLVWVPRYAYQITSMYHQGGDGAGNINVVFVDTSNKSKDGTEYKTAYPEYSTGSGMSDYVVHPAFDYGGAQISGFWVGKFETSNTGCTTDSASGEYSGTDKAVQIKAGVTSWRRIGVSNIYTVSTEMNASGNPYGLSTDDNEVDPHMMKNSEWGAVAYLSQNTTYGKGSEVTINSNGGYITGGGNYVSNTAQSTTGNITGVYDMSGGAYEYVAGYVNSGNLTSYGSKLVNAADKYKDVYKVTSDSGSNNYNNAAPTVGQGVPNVNTGRFGDATWETSNSYISERLVVQ